MTSILRALVLTGLLAIPAIPAQAQYRNVPAGTCMLDDGYGRLRPCSQGFKKSNPNWRTSDACYTDDGFGRYRPCSAGGVGFKGKQTNLK